MRSHGPNIARGTGQGARVALAMAACLAATLVAAGASAQTRSLNIFHTHTKEQEVVVFKRGGSYDQAGLDRLNHLLRDWRNDMQTRMDPRLFDVVWETMREVGSESPIHILSAYRSPTTNAMLRRRSRAVAKNSQHMAGKAMDIRLMDVSMSRVREVAMQLQRGGVGFYPTGGTGFVHIDVGSVRSWPRMTRDQLARLFPSGETVHLPAGGGTMPGYEAARTRILAAGGSVGGYGGEDEGTEVASGPRKSLWATLFGGEDEDEEIVRGRPAGRAAAARRGAPALAALPPSGGGESGGMQSFFAQDAGLTATPPADPRVVVDGRRGRRGGTQVAALPKPETPPAPPPPPVAPPPAPEPPPAAEAPAAKPPSSRLPTVAPLPVARPKIEAGEEPEAKPGETKPAEKPAPKLIAMPLPPPRPADKPGEQPGRLVTMPLPPARPTGPVVASLEPEAETPLQIGPPKPRPLPGGVLAFAGEDKPAPPPAATPGPRGPTRPVPTAAPATERVELRKLFVGEAALPPVAPLPADRPVVQAAARPKPVGTGAGDLSVTPTRTVKMTFGQIAQPGLATNSFTGPAVTALPTIASAK